MKAHLRFLLLLLSALAFNAAATYFYFFYKVEPNEDEKLNIQPPVVPIDSKSEKLGLQNSISSRTKNTSINDAPTECIEKKHGNPCKWWPKFDEKNDVACVHSTDYPNGAIKSGALFDTEEECYFGNALEQLRAEKRKRVSRGMDMPGHVERELRELLKIGRKKVLLHDASSFEQQQLQAETCSRLLQERADLQQEIDNIINEKKRKMHDRANITATLQPLEHELHLINGKIESLLPTMNCTYSQLILHRLGDGRLINDPTLPWNRTMYRPWLDPHLTPDKRPPFMLLLTTIGWNKPNVLEGLKYARHKFETEFYSALVNHPYFHPTAWDDIKSGKLDIQTYGVNYYVFMDLAQSKMQNYPTYAAGRNPNMDRTFHRTLDNQFLTNACGSDIRLSSAKIFKMLGGNNAKRGSGLSTANLFMFTILGHEEKGKRDCKELARQLPVVVASLDGRFPYTNADRGDQGMIPPLVKRVTLSPQEELDIETCAAETKKQFHVSYIGNFRSKGSRARSAYQDLHDNKRNIILRYFNAKEMKNSVIRNMTYEAVLKNSEFGLAPRGDNKYSFRFTEVLSAGAIPIYHADDYVFPLRPEVVNWEKCAVILPENMAGQPTLDYISNLTAVERCNMRKYCYFDIFKRYIETPMKQLNGYMDGLEAMWRSNGTVSFAGIRCNSTSIESKQCNPV